MQEDSPITYVTRGSVFRHDGKTVNVQEIEISPLGCLDKVHINNSMCFDLATRVDILR
jgi:hypothetical protein